MSESEAAPKQDRSKILEIFEEFADRLKKNWRIASLGGFLAALAGFILLTDLGRNIHEASYDLPFRVRGIVHPTEAAIVYMDEKSHTDLNQPYNGQWNRSVHAQLINTLTALHAKGIVFDVVFTGPATNAQQDKDLIQAIKNNGHVILAADYHTGGEGTTQTEEFMLAFDPPYKPLYRAAGGRIATDSVHTDDDEVIRKHLATDPRNDMVSSLGWAAATMMDAPITRNFSNSMVPFYLDYYGPHGTIPGASFVNVLATNFYPTNLFQDKMVFVGANFLTKYSGQRKDEYPTPFSYYYPDKPMMGGVEVQATAFLNFIRNERLFRLPVKVELPLIILCGLLIGFGLTMFRPVTASIAAVLLMAAAAAVNYFMFIHFYKWFAWEIVSLVQVPIAWAFSVIVNSVLLFVEKQKVEQSLALYLTPKLVKKFAKDPTLLKPGAKKQLLTILFSDIASFTTISEGMDSDDLAKAMNEYFQSAVHDCIHSTDGTVVKYIGDAIFAFWNAPDSQDDHGYRACEAALRFREQPTQHMNGSELVTRIGLHTGVANVGNFGSMTRVDYTALGENINLASRMEGLNKYLGTRLLITGETQSIAGPKLITRYLGMFRLKGFEKAVQVYELMARVEQEAESRPLREKFAHALQIFATKKFDAAEAAFRAVLEIKPGDGPSKFYLEQIEELRGAELPPDWKGEITLKDK